MTRSLHDWQVIILILKHFNHTHYLLTAFPLLSSHQLTPFSQLPNRPLTFFSLLPRHTHHPHMAFLLAHSPCSPDSQVLPFDISSACHHKITHENSASESPCQPTLISCPLGPCLLGNHSPSCFQISRSTKLALTSHLLYLPPCQPHRTSHLPTYKSLCQPSSTSGPLSYLHWTWQLQFSPCVLARLEKVQKKGKKHFGKTPVTWVENFLGGE